MLCILYVNLIAACLGIVGLLVEQALPASAARRWVWCAMIAASIVIPPVYRAQHNAPIASLLPQPEHAAHGVAAGTPLDAVWWTRTTSHDDVIGSLWLTSSAMIVLWGLAGAAHVAVLLHRSRRSRGGTALVDGVPVIVTDTVGPATVGLWRSLVLLPRWVLALPDAERRYVVRHEDEHRRAHDAHLLFVASLTLILVPWNVALWWQLRRLHLAVEMDCDTRVVGALGDAPAYGDLLLKVAEASSRGPRLQPALLGGMGSLERRLTELVAPAHRGIARRAIAIAVACAVMAIVLALPHPMPR